MSGETFKIKYSDEQFTYYDFWAVVLPNASALVRFRHKNTWLGLGKDHIFGKKKTAFPLVTCVTSYTSRI